MLDGEVAITFVPAVHSSAVGDGRRRASPGGNPGGFVIAVKGGPTIYHTGDTDVFGDMALIGKSPRSTSCSRASAITSRWIPTRAAEAVKLVKPKQVVPMHFGTFPVLTGTPAAFGKALKKRAPGAKLTVMEVGKSIQL